MRTICVTGRGTLRVAPDMTRIMLTLEGIYKDYGEALKESAESSEKLRELLGGLGFAPDELKTVSFGVNTEYESYQENGVYKQKFAGYRYSHQMKLEFASDNELLGRTLYALSHCAQEPEFNIGYFVKDSEAAKNALLANAVSDAKSKAAVLADAAGVRLAEIQSVDYSFSTISFETRPMRNMLRAKGAVMADCCEESYSMDIQPDDIEVTDTVNITWEIQ